MMVVVAAVFPLPAKISKAGPGSEGAPKENTFRTVEEEFL